jgi:hypothetical protein
MAENYPLVEQREYGRAERRGGILKKRARREEDDLPRIAAHQVRVFRVGEEYVADYGQLRADDPLVVSASSVTVVDQRADVPVVVETRIPSAQAGEFTVRVTYFSNVVDPCAVVRDGVTEVEALLLAQLLAVPGLTEDGSDLPIVESASVRSRIDARLTAYHEMRPAEVSGLKVRCGQVEVRTPEEQAAHLTEMEHADLVQEAALRREILGAELALKQEELRSLKAEREARNAHALAMMEEENRQRRDSLISRFRRSSESEEQEHDLTLRGQRNRSTRAEIQEDINLLGTDPLGAAYLAFRSGEISADELSRRLHEAERDRLGRSEEWTREDREYDMRRQAVRREEERWRIERADTQRQLNRVDQREDAAAQRAEDARRWNLEHKDQQLKYEEGRADAQRWERDEREWAQQQLAVRADLYKQGIARGLFDSTGYDPGTLINSVGNVPNSPGRPSRDGEVEAEVQGELNDGSRAADDGTAAAGRDTDDAEDAVLDFGGTDQEASLVD